MPAWKFVIHSNMRNKRIGKRRARGHSATHLTCAGPLHGKVHNVKTKNNVSPEIGGKVSATQRNMYMYML